MLDTKYTTIIEIGQNYMSEQNNKSKSKNKSSIYRILGSEGRVSHKILSDKDRQSIQQEINSLQTEINEFVENYIKTNPDKQTQKINATTNNSSILSRSSNKIQKQINKTVPTSNKLIKSNKSKQSKQLKQSRQFRQFRQSSQTQHSKKNTNKLAKH